MLPWLVVLFLMAVCALYVAAEFAAVSLPVSRLKPLAERGNKLAVRLLHHLEDGHRLDRYIAASQVGITWTSLVLGAYGQSAFGGDLAVFLERTFGLSQGASTTAAVAVILIALTSSQMILSELVPKSLALHNPLRTGLVTVLPMDWSLALYSFFIKVLNGSGHFILKVVGQSPSGHRHVHSPEELAFILKEGGRSGVLARHEEERLQGALKLSRRPVRHLMTPRTRMRTLRRDASPETVIEEVFRIPYTRIPVTDGEDGAVVGLVYTQDILKSYLDGAKAPSLALVMRPAFFVPEQMTADKLYAFFREHAAHLVMVVDEFGSEVGVVTLDDLMSEMLGDMPDEFKQEAAGPEPLSDGSWRLPGLTRIDEVERHLSHRWEGEAATLGGAILETLGRLPVQGERVILGGREIEVERVEGNIVASLLLKPSGREEEPRG